MNEQPIDRAGVWARMLDVLVCPGEVFEEVISAPLCLANWRVPTLLVALAATLSIQRGPMGTFFGTTLRDGGPPLDPFGRADLLAAWWPIVSCVSIFVAAFGGSIWSAFVLWFIGRVFLRTRFSWIKGLEIVGLSSIVVVLGLIITSLLVTIFGDLHARPLLSLLLGKSDCANPFLRAFGGLDFFNLWSTLVMANGFSRLSGVSFKEALFWVLCYWFGTRFALVVLA
jgi:hypothetical protein